MEQRIREAAAVEPLLRFPARIGLARVGPSGNGQVGILPPTAKEGEAWAEAVSGLGTGYGEFVPISPLIAAMLQVESPETGHVNAAAEVIANIRVAAARQHLDAVIIYELDATTNARDTALSIADWTLIGAMILPTQGVNAQAMGQAMILDVRNGYHYGTVRVSADDESLATRFRSREAQAELAEEVKEEAAGKLAEETALLIHELKAELGSRGFHLQGS